jgi:hypothetical protein
MVVVVYLLGQSPVLPLILRYLQTQMVIDSIKDIGRTEMGRVEAVVSAFGVCLRDSVYNMSVDNIPEATCYSSHNDSKQP